MSGNRKYLHTVHIVLLSVLAFGISNLNLLMSIATILLAVWWFVYPGPRRGWQLLKKNRTALALIFLFVVHLLWLINTEDWQWAIKDLRIKLTMPVLALAIGGVEHRAEDLRRVMFWFTVGLWVALITAVSNYLSYPGQVLDMRDVVGEISHIRLSLMMVVGIAAAFYFWPVLNRGWRIYAVTTTGACLFFLNFIGTATGFMALALMVVFTALHTVYTRYGKRRTVWAGAAVVWVLAGLGGYSWYKYRQYFTSDEKIPSETVYTKSGNPYAFIPSYQVENGRHTFYYLAEGELIDAWNERSEMKISGGDSATADLRARLYRYMTAKQLNKDREGLWALSAEDIRRIEAGFPAPVYATASGLLLRWHVMLYGVHTYLNSGDASGSSLFQRVIYWKVASRLILENFWTGTGTGDLKNDFAQAYDRYDIALDRQYQHRAHNQFLTFFVTFGVWGLLAFTAVFYIFTFPAGGDYFIWLLAWLMAAACMTEDTLETQAGVTVFTLFLVLYGSGAGRIKPNPQKPKPTAS